MVRAVPHLGPGVVLGVVEPRRRHGAGRGICIEVPARRRRDACLRRARQRPAGGGGRGRRRGAHRPAWSSCAGSSRRAPLRFRAPPSTAATCSHRRWRRCAPAPLPRRSARRWTRVRSCASIGGVVEQGRLPRRPDLPPRRGDLGGPLRQPAAGGHHGRPRIAGFPLVGSIELVARIESGQPSPSTGCRIRSCPTASRCAAWTRSAT